MTMGKTSKLSYLNKVQEVGPGTQEVEEDQEFKATLCYIMNSNPAWDI